MTRVMWRSVLALTVIVVYCFAIYSHGADGIAADCQDRTYYYDGQNLTPAPLVPHVPLCL